MGSLKISTHVLMQLAVAGHRSEKDARRAFSGVFRGVVLAGLDPRCCSRCRSLVCTLSYRVVTARLQHLEMGQDARRSRALGGTGLLPSLCLPSAWARGELSRPQRPLLLPLAPASSLVLPCARSPAVEGPRAASCRRYTRHLIKARQVRW